MGLKHKVLTSILAILVVAGIAWAAHPIRGVRWDFFYPGVAIKSGASIDVESGATFEIAGTAVTSTAAELNILDGVTATAAELNILDGVTSTAAELNTLDGIGLVKNLILCGQLDENGTIYIGPATAAFGGDGSDASVGSTACDALDNATEATVDAPVYTNTAFSILGAVCKTDGTLGSAETIVFTLRSAAADTTPALSCTISEAESDCSIAGNTTTDIAAGATVAVKAVMSSNNSDDNAWCEVSLGVK